ELFPREGMTLAAEVLQRIRRRHATKPGTDDVGSSGVHTLQEAGSERIADSRRIHDRMRRDGSDVSAPAPFDYRAAIFPFCNDERRRPVEHARFVQPGLLAD